MPAVEVVDLGELVHVELQLQFVAQQVHHGPEEEVRPGHGVASKVLATTGGKSEIFRTQH